MIRESQRWKIQLHLSAGKKASVYDEKSRK